MLIARLQVPIRQGTSWILSSTTHDFEQSGLVSSWDLCPGYFPIDTSIHRQIPEVPLEIRAFVSIPWHVIAPSADLNCFVCFILLRASHQPHAFLDTEVGSRSPIWTGDGSCVWIGILPPTVWIIDHCVDLLLQFCVLCALLLQRSYLIPGESLDLHCVTGYSPLIAAISSSSPDVARSVPPAPVLPMSRSSAGGAVISVPSSCMFPTRRPPRAWSASMSMSALFRSRLERLPWFFDATVAFFDLAGAILRYSLDDGVKLTFIYIVEY